MQNLAITQFMDDDNVPFLSPKKVGAFLSLQLADLARGARVHRNTVTSYPHSPKVQALLRNLLAVRAAASEAFGDEGTAITWMINEPLAAFRFKTAFALVEDGRTDDVIAYLDTIASGFVG
ncbi:MAG: DNA-binding protein [Rhodanobacter sp.]